MINKEIFFVVVAFVGILSFSLGTVWSSSELKKEKTEPDQHESEAVVIKDHEFTMTAKYTNDEEWAYTITGSFDNQCPKHDVSTELIDSKPELVKVKMVIYKPEDDVLCAQTIKDVVDKGTFKAGEDTEIEFVVLEDESKPTATGLPLLLEE